MMAIGIASIMPHACGGMILHVLIVIIQIKAPTAMSQIPPYQHHPVCLSGFNVGSVRQEPLVRVPMCTAPKGFIWRFQFKAYTLPLISIAFAIDLRVI